jgi:hypothetical protein
MRTSLEEKHSDLGFRAICTYPLFSPEPDPAMWEDYYELMAWVNRRDWKEDEQ